jgi:hypothetical protein
MIIGENYIFLSGVLQVGRERFAAMPSPSEVILLRLYFGHDAQRDAQNK